MFFRLGDTCETPNRPRGGKRHLKVKILQVERSLASVARTITYLKICASACLDILRSEPLPHFYQSQAFCLVYIKHGLVNRRTDTGREETGREREKDGGGWRDIKTKPQPWDLLNSTIMCGQRQGCEGLIYLSDLQEMTPPKKYNKYIIACGGKTSTTSVPSRNDKIAVIILVTAPFKVSESGTFKPRDHHKVVSIRNNGCTTFPSFKFAIYPKLNYKYKMSGSWEWLHFHNKAA